MITTIDTCQAADTAHNQLDAAWNTLHNASAKAWHETKQLAYQDASIATDEVVAALRMVQLLEAELISWQERYPDEHQGDDCQGDCPRDHHQEELETANETIWEQERDLP